MPKLPFCLYMYGHILRHSHSSPYRGLAPLASFQRLRNVVYCLFHGVFAENAEKQKGIKKKGEDFDNLSIF